MTWWCFIHIKYRIMDQFIREMETMSKNEREHTLCVHSKYYPFKAIQQHTIPTWLLGGQWKSIYHHYNVFFHHRFNASQGEMPSWGFLKEVLFVYDSCWLWVMWLQCPHSEVWPVLSCCDAFANMTGMMPFTRYHNVTTCRLSCVSFT